MEFKGNISGEQLQIKHANIFLWVYIGIDWLPEGVTNRVWLSSERYRTKLLNLIFHFVNYEELFYKMLMLHKLR